MNTRQMLALCCLTVFCAVVTSAQTPAADDTSTTFDRWYVLKMSGEHAGYAHTTERRKGDRIITQTDMKLAVRRGDQTITIEIDTWFVETLDGKPVEASSKLTPGALAIIQHARFTDEGIELTTGQGPAARTTTAPLLDASYLPPAAAQRYIERCIAQGDQEIAVGLIDASMGVATLDMSMKVVGEENVEVFGKVVPAVVWEASASNLPGIKMREYVDMQGRPVKSLVQLMPGMDFEMIEADEQLAKARVDPPRMMAQTLIHPDKAIESPRTSRSAIYQLSVKGDAPINLPRTGYQRVVFGDRSTAAVILDLDQPVNVIDDLPTQADLESSNMIDHESDAVRGLLQRALPDSDRELSDIQKASQLRAFVNSHIDEKDLSVGFATAGQVAATAQGDCTEHAVLLTALLRANDIPARTVTGLLYVEEFLGQQGVFGYHMWSQAWVTSGVGGEANEGEAGESGGRWIDLDAVLSEHDFDAAHIALSVASMRDGQMVNDMVGMLPTFGRLDIKVVEVE
jgi:hypothetical protein